MSAPCLRCLGLRDLCFRLGNAVLVALEKRIRTIGHFGPAEAGLRLEELPRAIDLDIPIAVGTVDIHIHVALHEESAPPGLRILEFQNRIAVIKIVPRKNLFDFFQALFQPVELEIVELGEIRRNLRGLEELRQRG